ncbi:MAG: hypothetical protein IT323_00375, partial [Anaerolineae bacterium]|nr:hypothetical protein [Anaerolineae bacterium]
DKGKAAGAGGGGIGARLGSLFRRGGTGAGTALVSQAPAVAPPKGAAAKPGAMPPARLDRQAKPLDYSQTQVAVRHHGLSLDQKLDLLGYALLIAAAVIIFGLLQPNEGTITTAIVNVLGGFFGAARYIIPMPVLAIGAWLLIRHFKENPFIELDILRIIGMVLMFLTLVTTLHFVQMLTVVVYSWEELTEVSARFVDLQWGGGWVGDRLYYILLRISGEYGIAALLIAAWVVSIMLTFEITLAEVSTYVKSAASWVRRKRTGFGEWRQVRQEAAVIRREAQAKARAEREAQKAARAAGPVSIERPVAGAIPAAATLGAGAAGGIAALGDRPAQATGAPGEPARLTATPAAARFNTAPAASPTPVAEATAAPAATADGPASLRPAPVAQRNRSMTMPAAPPAEPAPEPAKEDTPLPTPVARPAPMPIGSRTASKPAPESVKAPEPEPDDDLEPVKPVIAARPAPLGIRAKDEDKAALPAAPAPAAPNAAASSAQKPPSQPQSHPPAARPASPLFGKAPSPPAAPPAAPSEKPAEQPTEPEPDAQDTRPLERTGPMAAAGPASSGARPSPFKPLGKEADADKPAEKRDADSPPARVAALGPRPASGMGGSEPATKADTPDPADAAKLGKPAERPAGGLFGQRPAATGSGPFSRPAASKPATPAGDAGDDETEVAPSEPPARSPILGARPSPFSKPSAMPDAAGPDKADKTEDAPARPATLGSQPFGARPAPVEPRPGVSTGTFGAARPAPKPGQSTPAPVEEPDDTPEPDDDLKYEPLDAEAPADPADVAAGPVPPAPVVSSTPRPPTFVSGAARPSPFSPFGKRSTGSTPAAATETTGDAADTGAHKPLPAPIPSRANPFKPATPASKPAPGDDLDDDALNGDNGEDSGDENGDEVAVMPTDLPSEPVLHISEVKESGYEPPKERMGWDMPDYRALLEKGSQAHIQEEALRQRAKIIEDTLEAFGAPGRVVVTNPGPVITQFGVEPGYLQGRGKTTRVKVGAIAKLDDDLALALSARSIRIEAPVPGKSYVGIEVPNAESALVGLRDIVASTAFDREKFRLPIALGKSVDGTPIVADLTQMPHLLIAGTTGSGKSVCVNAIISCLLLENTPDDLQMIMVDPKRVELTGYNGIPHLVSPVVVDLERIVGVLKWVTREMEDRYKKFSATGARNIVDYNGKIGPHDKRMPYLVVVVDELADLMMLAPDETEKVLTRLAQMARATGIHLIISTQRPSVDVVTGLIKANFPARISFAVASSVDSRVVLDQPGAEKLLGRGDMLYQAPDAAAPVRMQGVYVSDNEINRITRHWKEATLNRRETKPPASLSVSSSDTGRPMGGGGGDALKPNPARLGSIAVSGSRSPFNEQAFFNAIREPEKNDDDLNGEDDDLYQEAVDAFQAMGKISISLLQRRLRIGFNRAARLIDLMKQRGVLGASDVAEPDSDGEE